MTESKVKVPNSVIKLKAMPMLSFYPKQANFLKKLCFALAIYDLNSLGPIAIPGKCKTFQIDQEIAAGIL